MFSNIKLLSLFFLFSITVFSQENPKLNNPEDEDDPHKVGSIIVGAYIPIVFGDNFVNNGMDLSPGVKIAFRVNTYPGIFVGPYFSFFNGEVTDKVYLGNYDNTTNFVIGAVAGYDFNVSDFDVSIGLGLGYSVYANRGLGDNFNDTATALWFSPEVSYRLNTYLGIFAAPELRHDFMNIEVPSELEDSFGGVNYFNLSFGLRINLGTGYKNK